MTKAEAHRKVRTALERGDLVRPDECEHCGDAPGPASDGRAQIQAHHADYSKPLDIEWICPRCHRKETEYPGKYTGVAIGEKNGQSRLIAEDVFAAKRLRARGMVYHEIAKIFGVDKRTIMRAIKGEQWTHVPDRLPPSIEEKDHG